MKKCCVKKIGLMFRIVDEKGKIAKTHLGNPVDGGGCCDRQKRVRQALHINKYLEGKNGTVH